jgi:hypothetical protein
VNPGERRAHGLKDWLLGRKAEDTVIPVMLGNISKRLRKRFLFEPSNLLQRVISSPESLHFKSSSYGDNVTSWISAAEGFEADQPGTLMIFDLVKQIPAPVGPDIEIRRVATIEDLRGFIAASEVAFGHEQSWWLAAFSNRLRDPDLALYNASQ